MLQYQNTMMQSFLVNTLLLALCSFSVVQFCMQAFKEYGGPNSAATLIFNVAARNLKVPPCGADTSVPDF